MARKPRKLGKRQQAIADKYAHILEAGEIRKSVGDRKYNKNRALTQDLKRLSRQSKSLDREILKAQDKRIDARPIIRKKLQVQSQLRESQRLKYEIELEIRAYKGYIEVDGKNIFLSDEPLTEEQESIIKRLERSLEEYTTGDMNITKFYNEYKFDVINETSLRLFAEGEGLI